eukprot:1189631-Amphidinium_carterae.1
MAYLSKQHKNKTPAGSFMPRSSVKIDPWPHHSPHQHCHALKNNKNYGTVRTARLSPKFKIDGTRTNKQ